jgi:hypothetical protein
VECDRAFDVALLVQSGVFIDFHDYNLRVIDIFSNPIGAD